MSVIRIIRMFELRVIRMFEKFSVRLEIGILLRYKGARRNLALVRETKIVHVKFTHRL